MADTDDILARSGLAHGVSLFGGIILATVGLFQFFEGLSAVRNDKVYASTPQYVYEFDLSVWGWFHLVIGALAVAVGVAIVAGQTWGSSPACSWPRCRRSPSSCSCRTTRCGRSPSSPSTSP